MLLYVYAKMLIIVIFDINISDVQQMPFFPTRQIGQQAPSDKKYSKSTRQMSVKKRRRQGLILGRQKTFLARFARFYYYN